ncbi:MAG TPA: heparan-alpha-glucosaminide N-acetyltransferase domain-containing protein [Gemmatimonadaceae bacterium]|nr:heparan-alpha-glucosaminide N-acetyltransferase domain-containing protein [Gemmatimonadaceae bacterium]
MYRTPSKADAMAVTTRTQPFDADVTPRSAEVTPAAPGRITSLDIIRGVIMVLMAIDHVRVYSGLPAGGPTAGIFFTRWITHFCAPGFVFLAGTAAFLHGRKLGDASALARFLVTRGLLLVVLELTVIRIGWTFGIDYSTFVLAGVIWMLGWCMVILAAFVRAAPRTVGWLGVAVILLQSLFALPPRLLPGGAERAVGRVWEFVHPAGFDVVAPFSVLYVLVPWIGVMMAGYGFGAIMVREPAARARLCWRIGLAASAVFLLVGGIVAAMQGGERPFLFRLLDQQKYPASQLFLLMTLGPMIALIPAAERARGWLASVMATIGRVPLFYYLLHIPLIHASALLVNVLRTGSAHGEWYRTAPYTSVPEEQRWTLALLYLVFAVDVAVLYAACRWYAKVKARRPGGWLRYI